MSRPHTQPKLRRIRRVNVRGLLIVGGVIVALLVAYFPIKALSNRMVRRSALAQAREIAERGDVDLALRHLERYRATWPDDISALEESARLRADSIRTYDDLVQAANLNDQLVRLDPDGKGRQETRRRLIRLWIRQANAIRAMAASRNDSASAVNESRYSAASIIARQLLEKGAKDAEAHRLLAQALDGMATVGDPKAMAEAVQEYEEALRLDPGDVPSAERLALIDLESRNDPAGAEETLDALLKARPKSTEVRLARYRYFGRARKPDRARAELEAALRMSPDDLNIRLQASVDAMAREDLAEARALLDSVPQESKDDLRVRMMRGRLELFDQHPDEAIEEWRKGLTSVGGSHQELTFQLAYTLIRLDRFAEARPLVTQFNRLEGDDPKARGRFLRGLFEQRSGHPARAIDDLERARDRVPEVLQGELLLTLGRCYEQIGDEARAMIAYRRAMAVDHRSPRPRRAIALMLQSRNPQEALDEIERALALSPNDPTLIFEVGRLHLVRQAALAAGDRKWRRLEELLAQGERVAPGNFSLLSLRADYLALNGRAAEGLDLLARAARGPQRKRPESWLAWASLLDSTGKRDQALKVLEEAARPDAAGDHARIRIARAQSLARSGQAQAAREALTVDTATVPRLERPDLSHALGDLLRDLGDREGARAAYMEWARLMPESPEPGLALLTQARMTGDDEAGRLGVEALRGIGGDREPYGLAAQVIELLRPEKGRPGPPPPEKLDQAERLVAQLQATAPQLMLYHLLRGETLEHRDRLPEAAAAYRQALKDDKNTAALIRLVGVLTRMKRHDELSNLKRKYDDLAVLSHQADPAVNFDRISAIAALKLGDKERAEYYAAQIVEKLPESLEARASLARLLDEMGKPKEAEDTLRSLVDRRPEDPSAWLALVAFQSVRGAPGEASRTIERMRGGYKGVRPELLLGRCLWLAGDVPGAAKSYAAALSKRPDDLVTLRSVAEFDEGTGRSEDLVGVLRHAVKLDPKAPWAYRSLALKLTETNDPASWPEAWALVAPGAPGSGESPEDRLIRATVLARSPEVARRSEAFPAMLALARDLPSSNPVAIEARVRLAQAMLQYDRAAEAARYILPVADDERNRNPIPLALAVEALARSGRGDEASARLDRLVAIEPKSPRTSASRAWVLWAGGKVAEAAAAIDSAEAEVEAESAPNAESIALAFLEMARKVGRDETVEAMTRRIAARWPRQAHQVARLQFAKGQSAEGLASCRAAMEAGSPREALRLATTAALARRGDAEFLKEADSLAEAARSRAPKDVDVIIFTATLRHVQDRYDEEIALYREALALNPPVVNFLNNMAWTLSEGLRRPEEALARVDEVIRRTGLTPQHFDTRGVILARLGRYDQAIADLEQSVKGDPSPATYFHLARAYLKAGKADDFRRCRDLARKAKLDPNTLDPTDRTDLEEVMQKPD